MTKKFFHKTNLIQRSLSDLCNQDDDITGHKSDITGHKSDIIGHKSDIIGHKSDITGHKSDIAGHEGNIVGNEGTSLYNNNNEFLILSNLTVLSKIQKHDKLVIIIDKNKENEKIDFEIKIDNTYIKSLSRWYYGQTRHLTIDYINKLIDIAILSHNQCNNNITMNKYITLLESAKIGLANLKFTYYYDQTIISNLDIIIEKIDMFKINVVTKYA
jgi:hypothetical protein